MNLHHQSLGLGPRIVEIARKDVGDVTHQVHRIIPHDRDPGGDGPRGSGRTLIDDGAAEGLPGGCLADHVPIWLDPADCEDAVDVIVTDEELAEFDVLVVEA